MNKWFIYNPESMLENETYNILRDFDVQTHHLISVSQVDLCIVKRKRTCQIVDFAVPADHRVKLKVREKRVKCLDPAREIKQNYGT